MSRRNSPYDDDYEDRWPAYVPVAERRRNAELAMEKLRKKGVTVTPVKLEGRLIASTFWGKAWCENLESYRDYANRLERGRTYVRNGSVVDLQIAPREVTATVSGSELYQVKISIGEVAKAHWKSICADCAGGIDSLVELLQGRFSKGVMERICRQGAGLFPKPSEIRFSCSCPDYASMCKHVAAVLYGVGARLDARPELLFRLRAVDENDLVADIGQVLPMAKQGPAAGKVLETDDMAALFGLDMAAAEEPAGAGAPEATAGGAMVVGDAASAARGAKVKPSAGGKPAPAAQQPAASSAKATTRKVAPPKLVVPTGRGGIVSAPPVVARNGKVAVLARGTPALGRDEPASARGKSAPGRDKSARAQATLARGTPAPARDKSAPARATLAPAPAVPEIGSSRVAAVVHSAASVQHIAKPSLAPRKPGTAPTIAATRPGRSKPAVARPGTARQELAH
jgi:uncharacterized Zn finger protein